ncbi:MAG TPA: tail fiber domain-containing protein [Bacteroidia bacterium]
MRTNKPLFALLLSVAAASTLTAQIKVFTGGNATIGATNSPVYSAKLQIAGPTIFTTATVTPTSSAYIRSVNAYSSASLPDYTWAGDATTGILHPAAGTIGFTTGGTERFRIYGYQLLSKYTSYAASTPDYSWDNDANTGIYHPALDNIGFVVGGNEKVRIKSTGQILSFSGASPGTPDFSWNGDDNTGMYNIGADIIGFATGSYERMRINASGNIVVGATTGAGERVAVYGGVDQTCFTSYATYTTDYAYAQASYVNRTLTKGLSVIYNGTEKFCVRGDGNVYAATAYNISDRNLKENIETIPTALDKVVQLRGVYFNYKAEELHANAMEGTVLPQAPPKKLVGLIAQEVEAVIPEAVETMETGYKAVAYQNLVGLLIEAIKEQNIKISTLENDLSNCCQHSGSRSINNTNSTNQQPETSDNQTLNSSANWLAQNKPNPFSKETVIEYSVVQEGKGSILIFDMNGKLLKTIPVKIPGKGSVTITGSDLQAGMYYYTLVVNDVEVDTKKMILTQ